MFCCHLRCNESAWVKWTCRVKLFSPHGGSSHICAHVTAFYLQHWGAFHRLNDIIISIYRKYAIQMNNWSWHDYLKVLQLLAPNGITPLALTAVTGREAGNSNTTRAVSFARIDSAVLYFYISPVYNLVRKMCLQYVLYLKTKHLLPGVIISFYVTADKKRQFIEVWETGDHNMKLFFSTANELMFAGNCTSEAILPPRAEECQNPTPIMGSFCHGTVKSVLTAYITVWFGNCTTSDQKSLQCCGCCREDHWCTSPSACGS